MVDISCRFCAAKVSIDDLAEVRLSAECPACGSLSWASPSGPTGYETVRQPAAGGSTPPSGTLFLPPGQASHGAPPRTHRRANLVVEGKQSANLPITGSRTEVGRKGTHLVIADPALSAIHFVIEAHGESFVIRDLGSSNGTRLNGHRIESSRLESGDTIDAGETRFSFRVEEVIPWDASR